LVAPEPPIIAPTPPAIAPPTKAPPNWEALDVLTSVIPSLTILTSIKFLNLTDFKLKPSWIDCLFRIIILLLLFSKPTADKLSTPTNSSSHIILCLFNA
jgi:hypothetical protein